MFRKARPVRAFQDIVDQVEDAIVRGSLKAGDRLPPERELCTTFQVSRSSVREALRVLEKAGLVVIKPGAAGGAYIADLSTEQAAESLSLLLRIEKISLEEMTEFREWMEARSAYWAAQRRDDRDLGEIEAALEQFESVVSSEAEPWEAFLEKDIRFHVLVAEASKNSVCAAIIKMIRGAMRRELGGVGPDSGVRSRIFSDHQAILQAISDKRPEEAEARMREHIVYVSNGLANLPAQAGTI